MYEITFFCVVYLKLNSTFNMGSKIWRIGKWVLGIVLAIFLLVSGLIFAFKDEIIQYVVSEINKNLQAKVKVEKIDLTFWATFPNISLDFEEVFISDAFPNREAGPTDTLLYTEKIRLKFNAIDVWNEKYDVKNIRIYPGSLQLKTDSLGEVNYNIFKSSEDSTTTKFKLELKSVELTGLNFSMKNDQSQQFYHTSIHDLQLKGAFTEEKFNLETSSSLHINQLKSGDVALLKNKKARFELNLAVNQNDKSIEIPKATLFVEEIPFQLEGKIDTTNLYLHIFAEKLELTDVARKLTLKELESVEQLQGSGTINFDLTINEKANSTQAPSTVCSFGIQNGSLREPTQQLKISNIYLSGKYSNVGGASNEFLSLSNMRFQTATGPFQGALRITQFNAPRYVGKGKGKLDLKSIHGIFSLPYIEKITGNLDLESEFDLLTKRHANGQNHITVNTCSANVNLRNINASLLNDTRTFSGVQGGIVINGDEAALDGIRVQIGKSDFEINGVFEDILPYLEKTGNLKSSISLESNLIFAKDLSSSHVDAQMNAIEPEKQFILPDNIDGSVNLYIGNLHIENHLFSQIKSQLAVGKRQLKFQGLQVENAGANVIGSVTLTEEYPEYLLLKSDLSSANISIKNLFQAWNNFDQSVILAENISGKAAVEMTLEAPFDLRKGIIKQNIVSKIHLKITDGKLKNVSTFKTITESLKTSSVRFLLKKNNINDFERKLLDLQFKTLENTLLIKNGKLEIPFMLIESNALNIETFGSHSFDNEIDYHFAFRFRDLISTTQETEFGKVVDDGSGFKIFMRMYGTLDKPIIKWDEEAKKQEAKENREAAKKEAISMLKSEFGWKKGDTTVREYQPIKKPKEEIEMDFSNSKNEEIIPQKKESEVKRKLKEKVQKMKENNAPDVEFEMD